MFLSDNLRNHEKSKDQTSPRKGRNEMHGGISRNRGEHSWWELQVHQEQEGGRPSRDPLQLRVDQ